MAHRGFSDIGGLSAWKQNVIASVRDGQTGEHLLSILDNGRAILQPGGQWIGFCQDGHLYDLARRYVCHLGEVSRKDIEAANRPQWE